MIRFFQDWLLGSLSTQQAPISPQEQALLAQLIDIEMPEPIGWWPPSVWLVTLISVVIVLLALLITIKFRHAAKNRYRKVALAQLNKIKNDLSETETALCFSETNALLKRCCISCYPESKPEIAKLWGDDFFRFIQFSLPAANRKQYADIESHFQEWSSAQYASAATSTLPKASMDKYLSFCEIWINKHNKKSISQAQLRNGVTDD